MKKSDPSSEAQGTGVFFDAASKIVEQMSESPYINFGYWADGAVSIADAQVALVDKLGKFCKFTEGMKIIDVGFGSGAQDLYWMERYHPALILGINVSTKQVELAIRNAGRSKDAERFSYEVGDACHIPEHLKGFDRVVGLESAHLFPDKASFLRTASATLKKGGRVCLVNLTYLNGKAFEKDILSDADGVIDIGPVDLPLFNRLKNDMPLLEKRSAVFLKDWIRFAKDAGLKEGRMEDISEGVKPFYRPFIDRINELLAANTDASIRAVLLVLAMSVQMRMKQFANGSLGYYIIEFIKK